MQEITVSKSLALQLSYWHSSQNDPVYAVSSSGLAKRPVPRDVFENALANMESNAEDPEGEYHSSAVEICHAMKALLGTVEPSELFDTVARSCSRTLWSVAWYDEADERGELRGGCDILSAAPETPASALKTSNRLIQEFLDKNSLTLERVIEEFKSEAENPHDFGHEFACALLQTGDSIDFDERGRKLPYYESYYYEFKDEWEG